MKTTNISLSDLAENYTVVRSCTLLQRLCVLLIISLSLIVQVSCSSSQSNSKSKENTQATPTERFLDRLLAFQSNNSETPQINSTVNSNLNPQGNDTTIFGLSEIQFAEEFLDYIIDIQDSIYNSTIPDYSTAKRETEKLLTLCDSVASTGYRRFLYATVQCAEKVLYNPRSPYIDEELYLPFAEHVIKSKFYPDDIKLVYQEQLRLASKNRIGTPASNFECQTDKEIEMAMANSKDLIQSADFSLSDITPVSKSSQTFVLLCFYDPDCLSCAEVTIKMLRDSTIGKLLNEERLFIMSIRENGKKSAVSVGEAHSQNPVIQQINALWKIHREQEDGYWRNWKYYCDSKGMLFNTNQLYALRAIPSFYLLTGENKIVILKDAPIERVINYLKLDVVKE